jgi:hypothetical protein
VEVISLLIGLAIGLPTSFFLGRWYGKRRTVKLFHELQDSGELVVMTKGQAADKSRTLDLLRNAGDEEDLDDIVYERRDSQERREDWAGAIRKGRQFRGED